MPAEGRGDEAYQEQRGVVAHHLRPVRPRGHLRGRQSDGVHNGRGNTRRQVRIGVLHLQQRGKEKVRCLRGLHEMLQTRM